MQRAKETKINEMWPLFLMQNLVLIGFTTKKEEERKGQKVKEEGKKVKRKGKRGEKVAGKEGKEGGRREAWEGGRGHGLTYKTRSKVPYPLGGRVELREGKGDHICNFLCKKETM